MVDNGDDNGNGFIMADERERSYGYCHKRNGWTGPETDKCCRPNFNSSTDEYEVYDFCELEELN